MSSLTCPECGARLAKGAERCDLCGSPVADASPLSDEPGNGDIPDPDTSRAPTTEGGAGDAAGSGVYCTACGWRNPAAAKFCSRCGTELEQLPTPSPSDPSRAAGPAAPSSASPPPGTKPAAPDAPGEPGEASSESDPGKSSVGLHVAILVGLSVLVVIALYMITVISKQQADTNAESAVRTPADVRSRAVIEEYEAIPIGDRFAPVVDSLRSVMASAEGSAAYASHRELVEFLADVGRIDRAAIEQQRLARQTDDVDDWRRAGNLLRDWMESVNNERRTDVALIAIEAYENVLDEAPDDLDARADLGWAYQYDPQNPMEAIEQTNLVLEQDPDHLAANFNRGVFLLRINRIDDAVDQFERVGELAEADSPYAQRAASWIRTIREQESR